MEKECVSGELTSERREKKLGGGRRGLFGGEL